MNRYTSDRNSRPQGGPKVTRVELGEEHLTLKIILAVLFLCIGVTTIAVSFSRLVGKSSGWQEIEVSSNSYVNCSPEFTLTYNLGASGASAGPENRKISSIYTDCCIKAYQLFTIDEEIEGTTNLYTINHTPNTVLTVDPVLYDALEELEAAQCRLQYLGPVYTTMENLCSCENDTDARCFDPRYDEATAADFERVLAFANDPEAVQLELLENDQVCLHVSQEYLQYAEETGLNAYVDLYRLKNAFITDYIADTLIAEGYTFGTLSSYDGYSRCLDGGGFGYSVNLYDRIEGSVYTAAVVNLSGSAATVTLHDFPIAEKDQSRYYVYANGEIITPYISPEDGLCHQAAATLMGTSPVGDCSALALALYPVYMQSDSDPVLPETLADSGAGILYCEDAVIYNGLPGATLTDLFAGEVTYTVSDISR